MLNTKDLVALTEHQRVGWRLINVENWVNKNYEWHNSWIWSYFLMKLALLQVILTLNTTDWIHKHRIVVATVEKATQKYFIIL